MILYAACLNPYHVTDPSRLFIVVQLRIDTAITDYQFLVDFKCIIQKIKIISGIQI